jgi:hypothetical protein
VTLPEVLLSAAAELNDALTAWGHVTAASDETSLMQYVGETEYAVKRCAALLDEWLTVGGSLMADGELF